MRQKCVLYLKHCRQRGDRMYLPHLKEDEIKSFAGYLLGTRQDRQALIKWHDADRNLVPC